MTSIFSDGALHPGRDANDAWWMVVRRPEEWNTDPRPGGEVRTHYDPTRMVLELAPAPWQTDGASLPSATAPDGTRYAIDPRTCLIHRELPCDGGATILLGVGGRGWLPGRFCDPCAIAIDATGLLYVVDRGNHRVQVLALEADHARVVTVLGGVDAWGRPCAGDGAGQLREPIGVAIGASRVWIALAAGTIQTYDRRFRVGPRFIAARPGASAPQLVAIAATGEHVATVETSAGRVARFDCRGRFVDELDGDHVPEELVPWLLRARFQPEGTRVVGPIDGGIDGLSWHHVVVDAELPPGTRVEIQTWAADSVAVPPPLPVEVPVLPEARWPAEVTPWAPEVPVAIPADDETSGTNMRPVLSDITAWNRWRAGPFRRGASWSQPLAGTGPNSSAAFTVPWTCARSLRANDTVELELSGTKVHRLIQSIAPREVGVIAAGDRATPYIAGDELWLLERDGRPRDPVRMAALAAPIDLSSIAHDGDGADLIWPHELVALCRPGDIVELRSGLRRSRVEIETVDRQDAAVTLALAVPGDFRSAMLRLVDAVGRMVVSSSEGWGDGFPAGSAIDVTYIALGKELHQVRQVRWSEPETATIWTETAPDPAWTQLSPQGTPTATDRGRYLFVKVRLVGARAHVADATATHTPIVRSLRVVGPRLSYLSYLPAVYARRDAGDPAGSLFAERFLALFEERLTRIEGRFELIARMLDPHAADDRWLDFIASWFDLVLDPTWPRARRAALVAQIFELYRIRGTVQGVLRFVELYTGHRPALIEGFQQRPLPGLLLGGAGALGCAPLGGPSAEATSTTELLDAYAHRLTLVAYLDDDCDHAAAESSLRALLAAIVPAHVDITLQVAIPNGRIGLESTIGLDFILGEDRRTPLLLGATGVDGRPEPILGQRTRLPFVENPDGGIQL